MSEEQQEGPIVVGFGDDPKIGACVYLRVHTPSGDLSANIYPRYALEIAKRMRFAAERLLGLPEEPKQEAPKQENIHAFLDFLSGKGYTIVHPEVGRPALEPEDAYFMWRQLLEEGNRR